MNTLNEIHIRDLGMKDYQSVWQDMIDFTLSRSEQTPDEIWLVEHLPVFTLGQGGKTEHVLHHNHIPVIKTDRGGQVTYHGPGQLVAYVLIDIKRAHIAVRNLVCSLEQAVIELLKTFDIHANRREKAPGIYVDDAKICSIGLRIKKGCSYHGLSFNVDMDLTPFQQINPCGFKGLKMTQLKALGVDIEMANLKTSLIEHLKHQVFKV